MAKINLLPKSLTPKSGLRKVSKNLKTVNIVGTVGFLFLAITLLGLIYLNSRTIKVSNIAQDKLKNSIKSMQQTEQQYTLVKNRLALIKEGLISGDLSDDLETFEKFVQLIPPGVEIENTKISTKKTEVQMLIPNSDILIAIFTNLSSTKLYPRLIINSLLLKQGSGYQLALEMYKN